MVLGFLARYTAWFYCYVDIREGGLENVLRGGEGVKEMEEIISLFFAPAKSSMLGKCQSTVKSRKRKKVTCFF